MNVVRSRLFGNEILVKFNKFIFFFYKEDIEYSRGKVSYSFRLKRNLFVELEFIGLFYVFFYFSISYFLSLSFFLVIFKIVLYSFFKVIYTFFKNFFVLL